MYRAGLEFLLGFELKANTLRFNPCIPRGWREYEITYRRGKASYRIVVQNPEGVSRGVEVVELDGVSQPQLEITLVDDGKQHAVRVVPGSLAAQEGTRDAGG